AYWPMSQLSGRPVECPPLAVVTDSVVRRRFVRWLAVDVERCPERLLETTNTEGELIEGERVRRDDAIQLVEHLVLIHELRFELDEASFELLVFGRLHHASP